MSTEPKLPPVKSETISKASSSLSKNPITPTKISPSPSRIFSSNEANFGPPEIETTSKTSSSLIKNPTQTTSSSSPSGFNSSNDVIAGPKKISCLNNITTLFPKRRRDSQSKRSNAIKDDKVQNSATSSSEEALNLFKLIKADLDYIEHGAKRLSEHSKEMDRLLIESKDHLISKYKEKGKELLKDSEVEISDLLIEKLKELLKGSAQHKDVEDLRTLREATTKLKLQIPSKYNTDADALKNFQLRFDSKRSISQEKTDKMPRLHNNNIFECSEEFKDFEALYNELDAEVKLCLLCFSIFPENAIIKKRLLVQWWVAEGFASDEMNASKNIRILMKKGFIEPVNENRSPFVGCYRMHPFYRSVLATLAERAKFFNFDADGKPTQKFEGSFQACLVGEGLISYDDLKSDFKSESVKVAELEKIHLLFNVDERILDFEPDWFSKMRNVNVLYLGTWKGLATDHIEVEDKIKFLDELNNMKHLRFLSLQGVSNILKLPKSILRLNNLKILDLRACHNLEKIPTKIGSLKTLTELDMSECYLLDHIPKSLSSLTCLRVLKGFVVGENKDNTSCTLDDLTKLPKLHKMCIYTGLQEFPTPYHLHSLNKLTALRKLTIAWGASVEVKEKSGEEKKTPGRFSRCSVATGETCFQLFLPQTFSR